MKQGITALFIVSGLLGFTNAQIKVACIGDSITEGYGLPAGALPYPQRLGQLLGSGYSVQNDGASGRTMLKSDAKNSYWKFGHLSQALSYKPNIVTIKLGTNDANNYAGQWNSVSAEFKQDYTAMIDTFATLPTKPRIFVVLPIPIRGNNDSILVKANAIIRQIALERGLPVIDAYSAFKGKTQLYNDGLHPNAVGADTLAHLFYRAIMTPPSNVQPVFAQVQRKSFSSAKLMTMDGRMSIPSEWNASPAKSLRIYDLSGHLVARMGGSDAAAEVKKSGSGVFIAKPGN